MPAANQEPILVRDCPSIDPQKVIRLQRWQWWLLVSINIAFLLIGQAAAVVLGRLYYDKGGNSKWLATVVQTAAFPILFVPYIFIHHKETPSIVSNPPSIFTISSIYFVLGALIAGDNMLYSTGLLYLSASTYSLICATQLAFNAVFSFFINHQKFTVLILNSVMILTLSASLLAVNDDTSGPSLSRSKYVIGFLTTLAASALYSLLLSLMQFSFQKVIKKETFSVVMEMQIYTSIVATCVSTIALFASGEWKMLHAEMNAFAAGRLSYVVILVGTAVAWQICSVGVVGLVFVVSSLYSNVISTLSLAVTPVAAVIVFHDKMNGVKVVAMLMALWGFASYVYQNYLDDKEARQIQANVKDDPSIDSAC